MSYLSRLVVQSSLTLGQPGRNIAPALPETAQGLVEITREVETRQIPDAGQETPAKPQEIPEIMDPAPPPVGAQEGAGKQVDPPQSPVGSSAPTEDVSRQEHPLPPSAPEQNDLSEATPDQPQNDPPAPRHDVLREVIHWVKQNDPAAQPVSDQRPPQDPMDRPATRHHPATQTTTLSQDAPTQQPEAQIAALPEANAAHIPSRQIAPDPSPKPPDPPVPHAVTPRPQRDATGATEVSIATLNLTVESPPPVVPPPVAAIVPVPPPAPSPTARPPRPLSTSDRLRRRYIRV